MNDSRVAGRPRWRQVVLGGGPALAAVAAIVLTVPATAPAQAAPVTQLTGTAGRTSSASAPATARPLRAAPRNFRPRAGYVNWGWLPAGQQLVSGQTSRGEMYLTAGPKPGRAAWALMVYAGGLCHRSGHSLTCTAGGNLRERLKPGPLVSGRRAFWGRGYLVWQYARGGWAWLAPAIVHNHPDRADAPRVARTVRFGTATAPALHWGAQLVNLPGHWRLDSTEFAPRSGTALARQFSLTVAGHHADAPAFDVDRATRKASCYFYPDGQSVRKVINGYRVIINHIPAQDGRSQLQQICAAHADGLSVFISEYDTHLLVGVVSLFRHHLRLLGAEPAHWATTLVR